MVDTHEGTQIGPDGRRYPIAELTESLPPADLDDDLEPGSSSASPVIMSGWPAGDAGATSVAGAQPGEEEQGETSAGDPDEPADAADGSRGAAEHASLTDALGDAAQESFEGLPSPVVGSDTGDEEPGGAAATPATEPTVPTEPVVTEPEPGGTIPPSE